MDHKSRTQEEHRARAAHILKAAGHPDAKQDKALISKMVHEHERHLHKGEPLTKLASGGKVRKGPTHVTVNVIHGDEQRAAQQGMQQGMRAGAMLGARQAAGQMAGPPHPPMPGGPPGAPPPGARPPVGMPPGARPPGMATGGGVKAPKLAGASSGEGRLQKTERYGAKTGGGTPVVKVKAHVRRKGGACP